MWEKAVWHTLVPCQLEDEEDEGDEEDEEDEEDEDEDFLVINLI